MLKSYRDLLVWQKGIVLVEEIYRLTKLYPKEELYGFTSQTRRAATSIVANIAEGFARKHRQEYIQFLRIAFGSGAELETHLILAQRFSFAPPSEFKHAEELLNEVMRMLNAFIGKLVASG